MTVVAVSDCGQFQAFVTNLAQAVESYLSYIDQHNLVGNQVSGARVYAPNYRLVAEINQGGKLRLHKLR